MKLTSKSEHIFGTSFIPVGVVYRVKREHGAMLASAVQSKALLAAKAALVSRQSPVACHFAKCIQGFDLYLVTVPSWE